MQTKAAKAVLYEAAINCTNIGADAKKMSRQELIDFLTEQMNEAKRKEPETYEAIKEVLSMKTLYHPAS